MRDAADGEQAEEAGEPQVAYPRRAWPVRECEVVVSTRTRTSSPAAAGPGKTTDFI